MIRLGYTIGQYGLDRPGLFHDVIAQAQAAEAAGFDSIWLPDHLIQAPAVGPAEDPMLECYTALGALAAVTSTVRLGSFVGCAGYRSAALLGKIVTTLDVVSGGRALFGIGAGWNEREHEAYGFTLGRGGERFDRLEETVRIVKSMFVQETTTFRGVHHRAEGALNSPRPVQHGGPPVMIGGSGQQRTLRLVAEHADICNVLGNSDVVRHLMSVLDRHCDDVGRDPASVCRTVLAMVIVRDTADEAEAALPPVFRGSTSPLRPIFGTPDQVVEHFRSLLDAGADGLILSTTHGDDRPEYIKQLAELAAQARAA